MDNTMAVSIRAMNIDRRELEDLWLKSYCDSMGA